MRDFRLYVIIDKKAVKGRDLVYAAKEAIAGGADVIQLRDKGSDAADVVEAGRAMREAIGKDEAVFIVNDSPDIALAIDADGVHLGQEDMPVIGARSILGKGKIIGLSTHSFEQALAAQNSGADYIGVGPVFSTPTKPGYKAVGLALIKKVNDIKGLPFVAIGGIDESNIDEVIVAGASRVAVVRAVCGAEDIREAAKRLKDKLTKR
ncbi:MAG: thiamine phosphate synthase [Candidatus Omnitrophica bacterium]|nr:thiamine phosphate synthase [Candidatus Omnitrophota bacterium]